MDIDTIFAIVYGIGVFLAIVPAILFMKYEKPESIIYGDNILIFIYIMMLSWAAVIILVWIVIDDHHRYKEECTPEICESRLKEQKLIYLENKEYKNMDDNEAFANSIEQMKIWYGENWQYRFKFEKDPARDFLNDMWIEDRYQKLEMSMQDKYNGLRYPFIM